MPIWNSGVEISFKVQGPLIGMLKYFRIWLRFCENILIKKLALHNNLFKLAFLFLCIVMCFHILFYPIIPLKVTEVMVKSRKIIFFNKTAVRHTFLPDNITILSPSHFSKNFKLYFSCQGPCCSRHCDYQMGNKCREDNGCRDESYCNGRGTVCPPSQLKPNRTVCHDEFVCFLGVSRLVLLSSTKPYKVIN